MAGTGRTVRVATLNVFGLRANWPGRRALMSAGFARFRPDLVALQEVVANDQARQVLGDGYEFAHHSERESNGEGISLASRWPISAVHEVDLHLGPRAAGFACSAMVAEIDAPGPVGRMLFVNHMPDWQLTHEAERERQAVAVAKFIEELVGTTRRHVVVAGDFNAAPDAASVRFWTGKQSLDNVSVCYRDAWAAIHGSDPGHTFTPENTLTTTAEYGEWATELGRRIDYILVRSTGHGPSLHITECRRLFDHPTEGVWPSDHFGVGAVLAIPARSKGADA
ncbi:endonuclease/exonuclease/phosphatase family protein [Kribbella yunnanensis]|uniref:Endonuclease/exonuclease/phosphatase family protein n=1 Tax=Kribbella yunnanensis TaxID=190194 RepID=A0ABN2I8N5_9ACTN